MDRVASSSPPARLRDAASPHTALLAHGGRVPVRLPILAGAVGVRIKIGDLQTILGSYPDAALLFLHKNGLHVVVGIGEKAV